MDSTTKKPRATCPFCGSTKYLSVEALLGDSGARYHVGCIACDAYGPSAPDRERAWEKWDLRYAVLPPIPTTASEAALDPRRFPTYLLYERTRDLMRIIRYETGVDVFSDKEMSVYLQMRIVGVLEEYERNVQPAGAMNETTFSDFASWLLSAVPVGWTLILARPVLAVSEDGKHDWAVSAKKDRRVRFSVVGRDPNADAHALVQFADYYGNLGEPMRDRKAARRLFRFLTGEDIAESWNPHGENLSR